MHIGFDISQTNHGKAGCGYFALNLIQSLLKLAPNNHYSLFPNFGNFYFDPQMPTHNPYSANNINYGPIYNLKDKASHFWTNSSLEKSLNSPDIIHANNFWCPIQLKSSKLVYTLYDIAFTINPDWTTETNRLGCFEGCFRSSLAADWVIAISEASRIHYLNMFPHFPEDRVRVIYPSSRFEDSSVLGIPPKSLKNITIKKFWLSVSTIEPRKNYYTLIKAYSRYLQLGGKSMPLVLTGGEGWLMEDFQTYLKIHGIEDKVILTGYVSDEEMIWLYRNCYANLYPSLFEGFGLPVLEGMQFGAATLASNCTSIPEVAGDAAILLSPHNVEDWAFEMHQLSLNSEKVKHLSIASIAQAKKFDSDRSGEAVLQLYDEAHKTPKRKLL